MDPSNGAAKQWEVYVQIIAGCLLCLLAPLRSEYKRTLFSLQFAIGGFAFGTIATLVFGEAYPQSASWERIETEALIVGASTMVAFVLVYLTTQAPFPVFVFGGYFGATLGASIMLLAAPTLGSPWQQLSAEAIAFVIAIVLLLVCNRYDFVLRLSMSTFGALYILEAINCLDTSMPVVRPIDFMALENLSCSASTTDPNLIGLFYLALLGFVAGSILIVLLVRMLLQAMWFAACRPKGSASHGGNLHHHHGGGTISLTSSSSSVVGSELKQPPLWPRVADLQRPQRKKELKVNRKRSAAHRTLGLKNWLEALKLNSAVAITSQQRLAHRLRQEGYLKEEEVEQANSRKHTEFDRDIEDIKARRGFLRGKLAHSGDSMFVAVARQLERIQRGSFTSREIRVRAVEWLRANTHWCSIDLRLYVPEYASWHEFCDAMALDGTPAKPLVLIAISEVFDCRITVYTDTEGDRYAVTIDKQEYMTISHSNKLNQPLASKIKGKSARTAAPSATGAPVTQNTVPSSTLPPPPMTSTMTSTSTSSTSSSTASTTTTGGMVFQLPTGTDEIHVVPLEGKGVGRSDAHLRLWQEEGVFGSAIKNETAPTVIKQRNAPRPKRERRETDMLKSENGMRVRERPVARVANITVQVLIGLSGLWWLVWILFFGTNFINFWAGIEYVLFATAELLNYVFGIVYFLNFCYPVSRRWRSLDALTPPFTARPTVSALIFHYGEDVDDTRRTINGCMRVDTMGSQIKFNIFVCDDGYFTAIKDKKAPAPPQPGYMARITMWFTSCFSWMCSCCRPSAAAAGAGAGGAGAAGGANSETQHLLANQRSTGGTTTTGATTTTAASLLPPGLADNPGSINNAGDDVDFVDGHQHLVDDDDEDLYARDGPVAPSGEIRPSAAGAAGQGDAGGELHRSASGSSLSGSTTGSVGVQMREREVLAFARERKLEPSPLGREMIEALREEMADYFLAVHKLVVDIGYTVQLTKEEDLVRPDCAQASVRYTFKPCQPVSVPYPTLHLVARVKPAPPRTHHHKAGNANNVIFNERLDGKYVLLLDNDMKPKPDVLTRMLPWFYDYVSDRCAYHPNRSVAFAQAPQHFTWDTVGPEDILCGRNSIFFSAIQRGRDGFDSCAFAGTNAIFRLEALRAVQGLPYESLTEDALLGMNLLDAGYSSVYVEDKLVVGTAPTTVAAAMQQRKRWCKGSIEILLLKLGWGNPSAIEWGAGGRPEPERVARPANPVRRSIFQAFFKVDTMVYPVTGSTALLYMLVALIFAISGDGPLFFPNNNYEALLYTFLPYYMLKILANLISYAGAVRGDDVWRAQEVWFSYAWVSFLGTLEALSGSTGWGLTGGAARTNNLEWFNIGAVAVLSASIIVRFVMFLFSSSSLMNLGAIFFASTIVVQLWPMVSLSLYERIVNRQLDPDNIEELQRIEIPNYLIYAAAIIVGIVMSETMTTAGGSANM